MGNSIGRKDDMFVLEKIGTEEVCKGMVFLFEGKDGGIRLTGVGFHSDLGLPFPHKE